MEVPRLHQCPVLVEVFRRFEFEEPDVIAFGECRDTSRPAYAVDPHTPPGGVNDPQRDPVRYLLYAGDLAPHVEG